MILFVGDLHYESPVLHRRRRVTDRPAGGPDDDRSLADCLESVSDSLTEVVVLGDLYDAFVEYRHLVPKGPARTLGILARLADRGITVTYVAGNHDPWHRSFIERDLGFRLVRTSDTLVTADTTVLFAHGDQEQNDRWRLARRLVRHPMALSLFTALTPGDTGQGLAIRVSRQLRRRNITMDTADRLRERARTILADGLADCVIFAHSHVPEILREGNGTYLNPGFWPEHRTVGVIDHGRIELRKWTDERLVPTGSRSVTQETPSTPGSLPEAHGQDNG